MIKEGKRLVKELGVHPTEVVEGIEGGIKEDCHLLEREAEKISLDEIALEQVVKTSLSSKLDGRNLYLLVISALRSVAVGKNALYNDSYDFDKTIMVLRSTTMEDRVVNGIVLERKRWILKCLWRSRMQGL